MSTQSLAQRRAAHALSRIRLHEKAGANSYGNYVSYTESLPATILMNGLGQAAATLLSKAAREKKDGKEVIKETDPHYSLYRDIQDWLCGSDPAAPYSNAANVPDKLMQAITGQDEETYLRAQSEALAYLVWLKKFANAYLERGQPE
jgi:CRISPR-associated protein Cmr5